MIAEWKAVGVNLNQVVRAMNAGRLPESQAIRARVQAALDQLRGHEAMFVSICGPRHDRALEGAGERRGGAVTDVHQAFRSWNLHCRLNREALEAEEDDEAALAARTRRSHAVKPSRLALGLGASLGRSGAKAGPRSPAAARRGLAAGSQAAVVKLASYAAGGARLGALLKYQSRERRSAARARRRQFPSGDERSSRACGGMGRRWRSARAEQGRAVFCGEALGAAGRQ